MLRHLQRKEQILLVTHRIGIMEVNMAKQATGKGHLDGYSGKGSWKETLTGGEPEGGQINERVDGFRARKEEMHKQDGKNR